MGSSQFEKLESQLVAAGALPQAISTGPSAFEIKGPIAVLVSAKASAAPYEDLLVSALPKLDGNELEMVVRCLSERGLRRAGPALVNLMHSSSESNALWAAGNAIATIADRETFADVVSLCRTQRLGAARQMLYSLLPRIQSSDAYAAALAGLDDETVRGHAIEAVGRFGNPEALPQLEALDTRRGSFEHRARLTAIRRLTRSKDSKVDT